MSMDKSVEDSLRVRILPTGLIVKPIITDASGSPLYDYEDWARELINSSAAFMAKTGGAQFVAPEGESHGEADAITDTYSLDFKLAAGSSMLHALRETSAEITVVGGMTLIGPGRHTDSMKGVILHAALRGYSEDELRRLWTAPPGFTPADDVEREIAGLIKVLKKKKNLFLIYPVLLYTDAGVELPPECVCDAIYSDFKDILGLRQEHLGGFDNYLAFLMEGHLVIMEIKESHWSLFDSVPVKKSKTFMVAAGRYSEFEYDQIRRLLG